MKSVSIDFIKPDCYSKQINNFVYHRIDLMLKRKLNEVGSALYRNLIFPFVRICIELKSGSIMKQKSYINKGTSLEGGNFIGQRTYLTNTRFGFGSMASDDCRLINTRVGRYSSIGPMTRVIIGKHPLGKHVSTHQSLYSDRSVTGFSYVTGSTFEEVSYIDPGEGIQIEIGSDVWIGGSVSILEGVTIGDGAVIGAGSLVLKDVEPYAVYAGVPAKKIKMRFDEEKAARLLELKWWDKGEDWIRENIDSFADVDVFLSKAGDKG